MAAWAWLAGWAQGRRGCQPFPKHQPGCVAPCAGKAGLCRETRDNLSASLPLKLAILVFFPIFPLIPDSLFPRLTCPQSISDAGYWMW